MFGSFRRLASLLFIFVVFPALTYGGGSTDDMSDIARLKQAVNNRKYYAYWSRLEAIETLGKIKNKESTEILLGQIDDREPPILEAIAMALGKVRDRECVDMVCEKAVRGKDESVRAYAAWALGMTKSKDAVSSLLRATQDQAVSVKLRAIEAIEQIGEKTPDVMKALVARLDDQSPNVSAAAARALGMLGDQSTIQELEKRNNGKNWLTSAAILEAVARLDQKRIPALAAEGLKSKVPQIRLAAMNACADACVTGEPEVELRNAFFAAAEACLSDSETFVRAAAVRGLLAFRTKECVELLVERLGSETGRLRFDIVSGLRDVTGKEIGFDARDGTTWWDSNGEKFRPAKKDDWKKDTAEVRGDGTQATFFDIPIMSDRVCFIIDMSGSMRSVEEAEGNEAAEVKSAYDKDKEGFLRKVDFAIDEFNKVVDRFKPEVKFSLIIINTEAADQRKRALSKELVPATDGNRKLAREFVVDAWKKLAYLKRGRGDTYDCVAEAFEMPEVDTIVLISDGMPTYGTYVFEENLHMNVAKLNRHRNVAIHTILTGSEGIAPRFMKRLAKDNMGVFKQK
jgi:HEAT repeat protein